MAVTHIETFVGTACQVANRWHPDAVRVQIRKYEHREPMILIELENDIPEVRLMAVTVVLLKMEIKAVEMLRDKLTGILDRLQTNTLQPEDDEEYEEPENDNAFE